MYCIELCISDKNKAGQLRVREANFAFKKAKDLDANVKSPISYKAAVHHIESALCMAWEIHSEELEAIFHHRCELATFEST